MTRGNPGTERCLRLWLENVGAWSVHCSAAADRASPAATNWDPVAAMGRRARFDERTHRGGMDWSAPSSTPTRPRVEGDPRALAEVADSRPDRSMPGHHTSAPDLRTS